MTSKTNRTSKTSQKTASAQTAQTSEQTKETPMTSQTSQTTTRTITHEDAVLAARAMAKAWSGATGRSEPKPPTERKPRAEKPERPCLCGCGRMTKSAFAPGHDAKSKSAMRAIANGQTIRVEVGGETKAWTPSDALVVWAKEHGWMDSMTPLAKDKHHAKAQPVTSAVKADRIPDMI